jgi:hypothetical protein
MQLGRSRRKIRGLMHMILLRGRGVDWDKCSITFGKHSNLGSGIAFHFCMGCSSVRASRPYELTGDALSQLSLVFVTQMYKGRFS